MSEANSKPVMTSISEALGMAPLILDAVSTPVADDDTTKDAIVVEPITNELSQSDKEAEEDFELTRKNTQQLLDQASEALEGILRIAVGSESPRAFEVAANLLKTAADLNSGLLKLHEQRRQLVPDPDGEKKAAQQVTNVQNNVFVGSTQDLLDMLEERDRAREQNDDDSAS